MALDVGSLNITFCPPPFYADSAFPNTGGYIPGRYCGKLTGDLSCCLPCPIEKLVYTDRFNSLMNASHWLNIPSLALQCLLLITFVVLKPRDSHGNFLNFGLCIAIIMLQLGFLIPLGTDPQLCHDTITPNDMYSDMSCAWTGALIVTGAMACASWVMLRSLYTHLLLCWDWKRDKLFFWGAQILGWGLPGLFLALTLPITGVSYRLGPTCVPNQKNSFVTWFGWLIAFGCIAALLTSSTTIYCLYIYIKALRKSEKGMGGSKSYGMNSTQQGNEEDENVAPNEQQPQPQSGWTSRNSTRKLAWSRVKGVLKAQLRSILISTLLIVMVLYYGTVFVKQTNTGLDAVNSDRQASVTTWAVCIVLNSGDKKKCQALSGVLGLDENAVIAAWFIAGLVGTFTFLLMFRRSMYNGWAELLRHPRQYRRTESVGHQDFLNVQDRNNLDDNDAPIRKHLSYSRQLESEKSLPHNDGDNDSIEEIQYMPQNHQQGSRGNAYEMNHISPISPISPLLAKSRFGSSTAIDEEGEPPAALRTHATTGILPSGGGQNRWSDSTSGAPSFSNHHEAGNVSMRHETTDLFFDEHHDEGAGTGNGGRTMSNRKLDNML